MLKHQQPLGYDISEVRQIIWRAVINALYFCDNSGHAVQERSFANSAALTRLAASSLRDLAAEAAAHADRYGTSAASQTQWIEVDNEMRHVFFPLVRQRRLGLGLAHLAFLLVADELLGKTLSRLELRQKVALAFRGRGAGAG